VLELLRERGLTLALAESVTGGLAGARIAAIPGSSDVFLGSVLASSADVRSTLMGTPSGVQIDPEAAKALAVGVRKLFGAEVGLAATGVPGPDEQEGQAPGTVWLGLALGDDVEAQQVRLPGDPNRVRQYGVISLLNLLRLRLLGSRDGAFR
jgi:nicotinamide-nucleotide amidase